MEPRLRAGLIAGGGAAIATLLLSLAGFVICGPVLAILAGLNAGFALSRDARVQQRRVRAASIAGLYAGAITGLAQFVGLILFVSTPMGQSVLHDALQQASQTAGVPAASGGLLTVAIGCDALLIGLIDLGVAVAAAALLAQRLTRNQQFAAPRPYPTYPPPQAYPPSHAYQQPPAVPVPPSAPLPPPPAYPPPPEFYGAHPVTDVTDEQKSAD